VYFYFVGDDSIAHHVEITAFLPCPTVPLPPSDMSKRAYICKLSRVAHDAWTRYMVSVIPLRNTNTKYNFCVRIVGELTEYHTGLFDSSNTMST